MKILSIFIIVVIVIPVLAYRLAYPSYTYRYRLIVEINTPEGVKSGSSVIEVTTEQWPKQLGNLFGGHTSSYKAKGEAVFVDLGKDKNAVMLLAYGNSLKTGDMLNTLAPKAFFDVRNVPSSDLKVEWATKLSKMAKEKADLATVNIPTIITFNNINDPKTAQFVFGSERKYSPGGKLLSIETEDNFKTIFGAGYSLKNVSIEITDDSLTHNIAKVFPWLSEYFNKRFDGNEFGIPNSNIFLNKLNSGLFIRGE